MRSGEIEKRKEKKNGVSNQLRGNPQSELNNQAKVQVLIIHVLYQGQKAADRYIPSTLHLVPSS